MGGSSAGLGKAQRIDNSLRADWLSCFSLAWWEWRVARQGCLVPLRKGGMLQSSRPASFSPAGLALWPSWLERWLATLSGLSVQVRIPVGLPGRYHKLMTFNGHAGVFLRTDSIIPKGMITNIWSDMLYALVYFSIGRQCLGKYRPWQQWGAL